MLRLRILFAWLLMAAVPLQGFAAVSMLLCGQGVQQQVHARHPAQHSHAIGSHDPASKAGTAHGASDAAHKCSICAACCNGVALVGMVQVIATAPAPQSTWAEPFVRIQARPSPVPDKPPRA